MKKNNVGIRTGQETRFANVMIDGKFFTMTTVISFNHCGSILTTYGLFDKDTLFQIGSESCRLEYWK